MVKVQTNSQGKVYLSNGNALLAGASSAVISTLSVTPTTSAQTITAPSGVDGYSPVEVSAVTSSIDANIVAGNIVNGVSILGVSGSAIELNGETVNITPTTSAQTITPTSPANGITQANVAAVTSSIDANIVAGNIKDGVTILGVTGDYTGGGSSTKYGASIDNFLGNTVNGVLETPATINGLTFTGVTEIGYGVLTDKFNSTSNNNIVGTVSFPDLITVDDNGLSNTFTESGITGINLSSLTTVGSQGLYEICFNCFDLTGSVNLSSLTTVGNQGLDNAFAGSGITGINLSSLTTVGSQGLYEICSNCFDLTGSVDLSSLTTVGYQGLYNAFRDTGITGAIDLSSLTSLGQSGLEGAFAGSSITSIDISGVTTLNPGAVSEMCQGSAVVSADLSGFTSTAQGTGFGYCFEGCENLTTVDLSNLTNLYDDGLGNTFNGCISLASIDLSSLTTVSGLGPMQYAFSGCSSLATVNLSSLETIAEGCTSGFLNTFENTALTTLSFPALKEQRWWSIFDLNDFGLFTDMLAGVDGCTVHFPSNLQASLGSIDDVVNGFGGTNTTVLFDLPSTANS